MLDRYAVEISEYENGVIDTGTGELVPVCDAPLPIVYERATKALAECARIDECQDWANKAKALASYARQSKDDTLRKMADRIQARAIRRCGELINEQRNELTESRDQWIAKARSSFAPSERKPCWVCGKFASITQAHHIYPLAAQWRFGIHYPIHDHEWLCPNHHVAVHILISQALASSLDASESCINVTCDLATHMGELNKVLAMAERFHKYMKGKQHDTR